MLELIFQGFVEWTYGLVLETWEYFSSVLLDIISMDFTFFRENIPIIDTFMQIMLSVGWALLIGNLVFQAVKSMSTGLGFEGEDPKLLFLRTFVFSFLLLVSPQICEIGLDITSTIIEMFEIPEAVEITLPEDATFSGLSAAWILVVITGVIIMFKVLGLLFEIAERHIVLAILTICAPLAFGVGGSRSTSDIFTGWCRMFASMCFVMVSHIIFFKLLLSVLSFMPSGVEVFPWMFLVFGIVKVARKIDGIITRIGLNPAMTGDPLGRSLPGMLTYAIVRSMGQNVGKNITKSVKTSPNKRPPYTPPNTNTNSAKNSYSAAYSNSSSKNNSSSTSNNNTQNSNNTRTRSQENLQNYNASNPQNMGTQRAQSSHANNSSVGSHQHSKNFNSSSNATAQQMDSNSNTQNGGFRSTAVPFGMFRANSHLQNHNSVNEKGVANGVNSNLTKSDTHGFRNSKQTSDTSEGKFSSVTSANARSTQSSENTSSVRNSTAGTRFTSIQNERVSNQNIRTRNSSTTRYSSISTGNDVSKPSTETSKNSTHSQQFQNLSRFTERNSDNIASKTSRQTAQQEQQMFSSTTNFNNTTDTRRVHHRSETARNSEKSSERNIERSKLSEASRADVKGNSNIKNPNFKTIARQENLGFETRKTEQKLNRGDVGARQRQKRK